MGADIHLSVEVKGSEENRWFPVNRNVSFGRGVAKSNIELGWGDGRNYSVFAMLADVRNGSGFAGTDLGDGFEPIDMPRGLPDDVSPKVKEDSDEWGIDGHSHSYFTLRELLDLEEKGYWDKTTYHRGVFTRDALEQARADGIVLSIEGQNVALSQSPHSWAGGIFGPDPKDIFNISWQESYRTSAGWLLNTTIPAMTEIASSWSMYSFFTSGMEITDGHRPYPMVFGPETRPQKHWTDSAELIRMVFWFDN